MPAGEDRQGRCCAAFQASARQADARNRLIARARSAAGFNFRTDRLLFVMRNQPAKSGSHHVVQNSVASIGGDMHSYRPLTHNDRATRSTASTSLAT
jgi:hypothetical protein